MATVLLTDVSALALLGIVVAALAVALTVEAVRLREVRAAVRGGSAAVRGGGGGGGGGSSG